MTSLTSFWVILVFFGGMLIPLQAGINMHLAALAQSSLWAALVSFSVGALALACLVGISRAPWPSAEQTAAFPAWVWVGGFCGAYLVWMSIYVAPHLGAAVLVAFLVAGQMLASLVFDHYGWLGFEVREINAGRILGALLVWTGAVLIRKF